MIHRMDYNLGRTKIISPFPSHYTLRAEFSLGMTAKHFFDATQMEPLGDILPEEIHNGEVIEIDDGLRPYYFYCLDYATAIPLSYFCLTKGAAQK